MHWNAESLGYKVSLYLKCDKPQGDSRVLFLLFGKPSERGFLIIIGRSAGGND